MGLEIRSTLRGLRQRPMMAAVIVTVLAIGLGGALSIFSVTQAVLLKPLPFPAPDRLVLAWSDLPARGQRGFPIAGPTYLDLSRGSTQFESLTGFFARTTALLLDGRDPVAIEVGEVTSSFLRTLGVRPFLGRDFSAADEAVSESEATLANRTASPRVMLLGHRLWQDLYGGDRGVVGRVVDLGGARVEIVGVLPAGLAFDLPPDAPFSMQVDALVALRAALDRAPRDNPFLAVMGRLKPPATIESAREESRQLSADLRRQFAAYEAVGFEFDLRPLHADLTQEARPILIALLVAASLLLVIACANIGGLLVLRGLARDQEFSLRIALGATRWQIFRQLQLESAVLAALGCGLAIPTAYGLNRGLVWWQPAFVLPLTPITIDWPVLSAAAVVTILCATVPAVLPLWQLRRRTVVDALRGRGAAIGGRALMQSAMVVVEVALAVVLLAGAGLLITTIVELGRIAPGYRAENVLSFRLTIPPERYPDGQRRALLSQALQQTLSTLPGVVSASSAFPLPLGGRTLSGRYGLADALADPSRYRQGDYRIVLPGYFETLRTRVIEGRTFSAVDNADGTPSAVIDRKLAERLWPGRSAVGERLLIRLTQDPEWVDVIGVVDHQRAASLAEESRETVYFSDGFAVGRRESPVVSLSLDWVVLASGPIDVLAGQVRAAVANVDPRLAVADLRPFGDYVRRSTSSLRTALTLLAVFAVVALGLAALGVYGAIAHRTTARTAEMAIRKAIGATDADVLLLVLKTGGQLTAPGLIIGLVCALWTNRVLALTVAGVSQRPTLVVMGICGLLLIITAAAVWIPARRASRISPATITRA